MPEAATVTTFLFSDIEGSTALWEASPGMSQAMAAHDALARTVVAEHRGTLVKMTGDGVHAAFADPLDAVKAAVAFQLGCARIEQAEGIPLHVRCGIHAGTHEQRGDDFYGPAVNRAARIMSVAHGGQVLVSNAVAALLLDRLPASIGLRSIGKVHLRGLTHEEPVHQVVHPGLRDAFPALRSLAETPHNLAAPLNAFIGRERELAEVGERLRAARLVTLVGPGGIGKTRLSLEAAHAALADHPDGVWLVELAPLHDPQLVLQAVASQLKVREEPGEALADALARHVRDRTLLVLLDNCEHLLGACADVVNVLLRAGAGVRVLASSREPLRVAAESCYPVPALAVPAAGGRLRPEALLQLDSVRLFVDRARAADPRFVLDARTSGAVASICRRLDGIPLALELAAARTRAFSVADIERRLDDRFAFLRGGDRTALPRQQTLRALIDWSHDLLDAKERVALRRLAVFAGGFTADAAECVVADAILAREDVPDTLARLADKSLVAHEPHAGRYQLLETIRQYAHDRLTAADEGDAVRGRHLSWCCALVQRARESWAGPEQGASLARLDLEHDNVLAAYAHATHSPRHGETAFQLLATLKFYWINRGLLRLGQRMTLDALGRAGDAVPRAALCRALFDAGQLSIFLGRYDEGRGCLDRALEIARAAGDGAMVERVLQPLCIAALGAGNTATAGEYARESLRLAEAHGDQTEIAAAAIALAQVHRAGGSLERAEPLYHRALEIATALGNREYRAMALLNLAALAIARAQTRHACALLREVAAIAADTGSQPVRQGLAEACAALAAEHGDWLRAARLVALADAGIERTGIVRDPADAAALAPYQARIRAALEPAALTRSAEAARELAPEAAVLEISEWLDSRVAASTAG